MTRASSQAFPSPKQLQQEVAQLKQQLQEMYASSHEMIKTQSQLESILHNAGEGMIIFNPDGTVKSLNLAAQKIFGYSEVELMFQHIPHLFQTDDTFKMNVPGFLKKQLADNKANAEHPLIGIHKSGQEVPLAISISEVATEEMMFFDDFADVDDSEEGVSQSYDLFACIVHDLTEDIKAQQKLQEQNLKLEKAYLSLTEHERMRSEFMAKVSHELLTPLNGVIGVAEIIKDEVHAEQADFVQVILESGHRLLSVIHNILEFDKRTESEEANKTDFDLKKIIGKVLESQQKTITEKNLTVQTRYSPDNHEFPLHTNPQRVTSIVENVLDNAIKFTPTGHIQIEATIEPSENDNEQRFTLTVTDTGIGIHEEVKTKIFLPFFQIEETLSRQYGGVGMGLAITKQIIESLNGTISLDSTPGKGSIFSIFLPMAVSQLPVKDIFCLNRETMEELKELLGVEFNLLIHTASQDLSQYAQTLITHIKQKNLEGAFHDLPLIANIAEQFGAQRLLEHIIDIDRQLNRTSQCQDITQTQMNTLMQEVEQVVDLLLNYEKHPKGH